VVNPTPIHADDGHLKSELERLKRENDRLKQENAHLYQLAYEDPLTGIGNKRLFDDELDRLQHTSEGFCVAIIDLDHFKKINDDNGHAMGDRVLKKFGGILIAEQRGLDTVARIGGEEFGVILRACNSDGAEKYLNRLLNRVREDLVLKKGEGRLLRVTASVGYAEYRLGEDVRALQHRADEAMYRAKDGGRDCVVAAS
jgi:diguanylate cyclase (GGDEF)-like protein